MFENETIKICECRWWGVLSARRTTYCSIPRFRLQIQGVF